MRRGWIAALPLALIALASCTSDDSEVKTEPSLGHSHHRDAENIDGYDRRRLGW